MFLWLTATLLMVVSCTSEEDFKGMERRKEGLFLLLILRFVQWRNQNSSSGRMDPILIVIVFGFKASRFYVVAPEHLFGPVAWRGREESAGAARTDPCCTPTLGVRSKQLMTCFWFSIISWNYNVKIMGRGGCFLCHSLYQVFCWSWAFAVLSGQVLLKTLLLKLWQLRFRV